MVGGCLPPIAVVDKGASAVALSFAPTLKNLMSPIIPQEGWIVQHLFYNLDHGFWAALTPEEKEERIAHLNSTVQSIRSHP